MNEILPFLMAHWIMTGAFFVVAIAIILFEIQEQHAGSNRLNTAQAIELINHHDAVVVDLRAKEEFKKGHIINAVNLMPDSLEKNESAWMSYKASPILLVSQQGQVDRTLIKKLESKGLTIKILAGGLDAWKSSNLPIEN